MACGWALEALCNIRNKFESNKYRPIWKISKFGQYFLHVLLQNFQFCSSHNLLNFYHLREIMDFIEILRCPINSPFGFIFIEDSMLMYTSLEKDDFLLTFRRTHNSQMKHFWPNLVRHKVVEN